ncbi:unnamed protein product [Cuscuta campestris]|uniref:Uncharacterized protein n=1 Tax=Cuscuta campestris TaxID=132261 RepID=A0A484KF78_9ASTE|nr:unnamed protein product [Cuscuta campestris]
MDTKSLAKSKRAHSLHLSKKNQQPHPSKVASAGPSSSSTGDKKQSRKQGKDKPAQGHGSKGLPLIWDRYVDEGDEGYELDSGNVVPRESSSEAGSDVVAPKTKGADYAYLISEAKAQSGYSSQSEPLFDDVLHDFYQGFGPLLSMKGQSIASWIADDIFGSEDKAPPPDEATFLSLNLHTLAEQLAKATLSERLFIDPDLPELLTEELQKLSENKHEEAPAKRTSGLAEEVFDVLATKTVSEDSKSLHNFVCSPSDRTSTATSSGCKISVLTGEVSKSTGSGKDEALERIEMGQTGMQRYAPEFNANSAAKKPSKFEAEDELDMLLGSFTDKPLEPERIEESHRGSFLPQKHASSSSSLPERASSSQKVPNLSAPRDMKLEDSVDDLLNETSILTINKRKGSPADEAKAVTRSNKLSDDFDSWFDTI